MTACRLYLITPKLTLASAESFGERFGAVARASQAASALARVAPTAAKDAKRILGPLVEIAIGHDVALIVEADVRLAARLNADGAQVAGAAGAGDALRDALKSLHPERIVGVGTLRTRDEAMEAAEAGADYVMFGEPRSDGWTPPFDETLDRVKWWAEIFETPCVGFAHTLPLAEKLAAAGADFVALGDVIWSAPSPEEAAKRAALAIAVAAAARTQ